jgi:GAF domain-containing protein
VDIWPFLSQLSTDYGRLEPGELNAALTLVATAAAKAFGSDPCVIHSINPLTGSFNRHTAHAGQLFETKGASDGVPGASGLVAKVLTDGELWVPDLAVEQQFESRFTRAEGVGAFAAVCLYAGSVGERERAGPLGVLFLNYRQPRAFAEDERIAVKQFADHAAVLLKGSWLLRRYQGAVAVGQSVMESFIAAEGTLEPSYEPANISFVGLFRALLKQVAGIIDVSRGFTLGVYRHTSDTWLRITEKGIEEGLRVPPWTDIIRDRSQGVWATDHFSNEPPERRLPFSLEPSEGQPESAMYVPLRAEEVGLGLLAVRHPARGVYGQADRRLLELIGGQVAAALSNIRQANILQSLHAAGQELARSVDSPNVLQTIANTLRARSQADVVVLYTYRQAVDAFEPPLQVSGRLIEPERVRPDRVPTADDVAVLTLHQTAPVFAPTPDLYRALGGKERRTGSFDVREQVASTAALPLSVGNECVGALFFNYRSQQPFDTVQRRFLAALANDTAATIQHARARERQEHEHLIELEALRAIDHALAQTIDLQPLLHTILNQACRSVAERKTSAATAGDLSGSILLYEEASERLITRATIPDNGPRREYRVDQASLTDASRIDRVARAFHERSTALVNEIGGDPAAGQRLEDIGSGHAVSELIVPLVRMKDEHPVGMLHLESRHPRTFNEKDRRFLSVLAEQIVLAIRNAQAYTREQRIAGYRQVLVDTAREIATAVDVEPILEVVLRRALKVTDSYYGNIARFDEQQGDLVIMFESVDGNLRRPHYRQPLSRGIVGMAATKRETINATDVSKPPWREAYFAEMLQETQSELAVPITDGTRLLGVINIESPLVDHFDRDDEQLLEALAGLTAVTLQNAERYRHVEEGRARLEALQKISQSIVDSLAQPDTVIRSVTSHARNLVQATFADLDLHDEAGQVVETYQLRPTAAAEVTIQRVDWTLPGVVPPRRGIMAEVVRTQRPYRTGDAQRDPYFVGKKRVASELAVPLLADGRLVGVLDVESERPNAFDESDERLLQLFGDLAAIAIRAARTQAEIDRARDNRVMAEIGLSAIELAHRLGNALGFVPTHCDRIRDELGDAMSNEIIDRELTNIDRKVRSVLRFTTRLKTDLAGINAREQPRAECHAVHSLLDDALRGVQQEADGAGVVVRNLTNRGALQVFAPAGQVQDILRNLCTNALEAMPRGGTLSVQARAEGANVVIEVEDTGPGISERDRPRVFYLFFSTKGSSGFGLWSARTNAKLNNGDLRVRSELGKGTVFSLILPACPATSK